MATAQEFDRRTDHRAAELLHDAKDRELLAQIFSASSSPYLHRRAIELLRTADTWRAEARKILGLEGVEL